ncbi:MAG: gamma carbonic anhydrase family protein [Blastocatellia bacterium]|nr:gamma carbonic anhydrase family protein [Blastocatellia bacterium]
MIIEHCGKRPRIHPTAYVAPNAVVSGDVTIGEGTRVLFGAVISSEGAPIRIGRNCVIMENAVVRAAGGKRKKFPTDIGDSVLIGPSAYVTGCRLEYRAFIATGAVVLNGSIVEANASVTLGAVVHIGTRIPAASVLPLKHIAIGDPCRIYTPSEADNIIDELMERNYKSYVFGLNEEQVLAEHYSRSLRLHLDDREVEADLLDEEMAPIATVKPTRRRRKQDH